MGWVLWIQGHFAHHLHVRCAGADVAHVEPWTAGPHPIAFAAGITSGPPKAEPVGVVQLLRSSAVWAIIVVNIVNHWGYFIYLNWIPSYFYKVGLKVSVCAW